MKSGVIFLIDGRIARIESSSRELVGVQFAVVDGDRVDMLRTARLGVESEITTYVQRAKSLSQEYGLATVLERALEEFQRISHARWQSVDEQHAAICAAAKRVIEDAGQAMRLELLSQDDIEQQAAERYGRDWAIEPEAA